MDSRAAARAHLRPSAPGRPRADSADKGEQRLRALERRAAPATGACQAASRLDRTGSLHHRRAPHGDLRAREGSMSKTTTEPSGSDEPETSPTLIDDEGLRLLVTRLARPASLRRAGDRARLAALLGQRLRRRHRVDRGARRRAGAAGGLALLGRPAQRPSRRLRRLGSAALGAAPPARSADGRSRRRPGTARGPRTRGASTVNPCAPSASITGSANARASACVRRPGS